MSQSMGMADGRCFGVHTSAQLFNDYLMNKNNISYADNYSYRKFLQQSGPSVMDSVNAQQPITTVNQTPVCNKALLNVSNIY